MADPVPPVSMREFIERVADERWESHLREHLRDLTGNEHADIQHRLAHDREHAMTAEAIKKAETAVERALIAAKQANDDRFKSMLDRQEQIEKDFNRRLTELERSYERGTGRDRGVALSWGILVAAVGLIIMIAGYLATRGGP